MNKAILNKKVQEFIDVNLRLDTNGLILKKSIFIEVSNKELAEQIIAKLKCKDKLPTWFGLESGLFPVKISIEQTSSEETAKYKASLISGKNIVDLTGGFGVDDFYFSRNFESIIHCELNPELSEITEHNFKELGVGNCTFFAGDGLVLLQNSEEKFDWIYLDPSRRSDVKGKVFLLKDCLPNVPDNLELLFLKSNNVMMKTSPLVDISQGISELKGVKEIHVVAVKNEVKELLWILEKESSGDILIKTVNLIGEDKQEFEFALSSEGNQDPKYSLPLNYLYEPNSAILKSGAFNQVSVQLELFKLNKHSHLYTSQYLIPFPGRSFEIKEVIPFQKKVLKKRFGGSKANITIRNFPNKVDELRKDLNIKDGGDVYLFFTTNRTGEKVCLVCGKV
ncbi:MAG: class I SAM-dependent methyltransferase [Flavobacteriales bacterium]|nr:class I SAM-dependent methyltransferase [Flavobacteriales bacterium]